jgi:uncharacterized RDD family membrane protein YckC
MKLNVFLKRFGGILIYVILTLAILIYIANLSHLSREEMRGVPMGPLMYSLAYSVVWSVISAYLIIYYCLKTEVYSRRIKLGIAGLCLIAPWLIA